VGGLGAWGAGDRRTGAAVVVGFGVVAALVGIALAARARVREARRHGPEALRGVAIVACALVGLAGLSLVLAPRMDHWWLDWLEASLPATETVFLSSDERAEHREAVEDVQRSLAEL